MKASCPLNAKSKAAPDSLPSFCPLMAVSGAQVVRVRCSLRFEFRDVRDSARAVDKPTLTNAVKKSVAELDGPSAKDLEAGLAEAQAGIGGAGPTLSQCGSRIRGAEREFVTRNQATV